MTIEPWVGIEFFRPRHKIEAFPFVNFVVVTQVFVGVRTARTARTTRTTRTTRVAWRMLCGGLRPMLADSG